MTVLHEKFDVTYLPIPNSVKFISDDELTPLDLTKTSFMIPLLYDGSVVMAQNRRRGLEFPGGHIDPGETSCFAAVRETFEETGYRVSHIRSLGYLLMQSSGEVPADWKYPHPIGFQQFYVGRVMGNVPYEENDECLAPVILSPEQARNQLDPQRLSIYEEALRVLQGVYHG